MSRGWIYVSGDWNLLCDVCAKKIKASKSKERWDGFRVCHACFEPRHPMDFIRARTDKITVPFTRPQPTDTFVGVCSPDTISAIPGLAGPGCCLPGKIYPGNSINLNSN